MKHLLNTPSKTNLSYKPLILTLNTYTHLQQVIKN